MERQQHRRPRIQYRIRGQPHRPLSDLYHLLMRGSWWRILLFAVASYVVTIGLFAGLYLLGGDCIEGAEPGSRSDAFWFSMQTFSTIGYGLRSPVSPWVDTVETTIWRSLMMRSREPDELWVFWVDRQKERKY